MTKKSKKKRNTVFHFKQKWIQYSTTATSNNNQLQEPVATTLVNVGNTSQSSFLKNDSENHNTHHIMNNKSTSMQKTPE